MGRIHDVIADCLAAEVKSRTEWDEPPVLYFLYLHGGEASLRQLPVPGEMWGLARPPQVLAGLAESLGDLSELLQAVAPEGLHGAAFRCEAWQVDAGMPGTARRSAIQEESWAKRLHQHPDRVEIRSAYAVDRAGITYAAVQRRGSDDVDRTIAFPGVAKPGFAGAIPGALDRLVTAVLGVTMPARPSALAE